MAELFRSATVTIDDAPESFIDVELGSRIDRQIDALLLRIPTRVRQNPSVEPLIAELQQLRLDHNQLARAILRYRLRGWVTESVETALFRLIGVVWLAGVLISAVPPLAPVVLVVGVIGFLRLWTQRRRDAADLQGRLARIEARINQLIDRIQTASRSVREAQP